MSDDLQTHNTADMTDEQLLESFYSSMQYAESDTDRLARELAETDTEYTFD
jgi:hypothetical protein